jgi:Pyruvate/2-oxoacid:ferredoxin oxidoreductase delta subunit
MSDKIKVGGLVIFLVGLVLFIVSLTLSNYMLKEASLPQSSGEKFEKFRWHATESMKDKMYTSNIVFVGDLDIAFRATNAQLVEKYSISKSEIERLSSNFDTDNPVYDVSWIDSNIKANGEVGEFKNQALKDYTSWMSGKSYKSETELKKALQDAARRINGSISYSKGFDNYTKKNLKFQITRDSTVGKFTNEQKLWRTITLGFMIIGALLFFWGEYQGTTPGIKNDRIFHISVTSIGWVGIVLGIIMISFYLLLYFYPEYITNWVLLVDPLSLWLNGNPASHWFLYGFLYTIAVLVMGIRMLYKYRHNRYQLIRTFSVMFFQLAFAFIIPEILISLNKPGVDLKNIWPLDYDFFYSYNLQALIGSGTLGWFMLFWGIALIVVAVPVFTYFYGKRWYCSWVCGCGGLAETLGDPFRQLSDKSLKAWKIERWLIHGVLVFAIINTAAVLYTYFTDSYSLLGLSTEDIKKTYGFMISSMFAGVIGTGFYPLMGNRVWCRFGCPLAAYIGLVQRFKSRFRITTNGGQCISCGNCSTYCEMGIDVRWYAQRGQNIIRSSCVGCGICSAVCPRGVLKLENGPEQGRFNVPVLIGNKSQNS